MYFLKKYMYFLKKYMYFSKKYMYFFEKVHVLFQKVHVLSWGIGSNNVLEKNLFFQQNILISDHQNILWNVITFFKKVHVLFEKYCENKKVHVLFFSTCTFLDEKSTCTFLDLPLFAGKNSIKNIYFLWQVFYFPIIQV